MRLVNFIDWHTVNLVWSTLKTKRTGVRKIKTISFIFEEQIWRLNRKPILSYYYLTHVDKPIKSMRLVNFIDWHSVNLVCGSQVGSETIFFPS